MATAAEQRDVYANLLRETRELRRDQALARDNWYATLSWDRKEDTLFELEMLLKGIACFGNPRNHPGGGAGKLPAAQDFSAQLRVAREGAYRVVQLARALLGEREKENTFSRYLETVLPGDAARGRLLQEQLTQDTPEESLLVLRNAFGHYLDLADGLLRGGGRASHRVWAAYHGTVVREIGRNAFFNPLMSLEFRSEFDRIRSPDVLDVLNDVHNEAAHRVAALTFLTLFRCQRYTELLDSYAPEPTSVRRGYLVLAVLRSDLRALTRYLSEGAAIAIADGVEREILSVPASVIGLHYGSLATDIRALVSLRGMLEGVASGLRMEVRRVFERDVPSPDEPSIEQDLGAQMSIASATIRAAAQHAIRVLCAELRPGDAPVGLGEDLASRRASSERLRREIWIFRQILRAFLALAASSPKNTDTWVGPGGFQFVKDFQQHFRAIGYQLLRTHDYERIDPFLAALDELRDVDLLEASRLEDAVRESQAFSEFLSDLFQKVSARRELEGVPFDKQTASEMLRVYLGR